MRALHIREQVMKMRESLRRVRRDPAVPFPNLKIVQQLARMTNSITLQAGIVAGTIPADEGVGELFNLEPDQVANLKTINPQQIKQYLKDLKELKNNASPLTAEAKQLEVGIVMLEKWNRMYAEVGNVKDMTAGTKYFKDVKQASGKGLDKDFMKNSGAKLGTYSRMISSLTSSNPSNQDAMRELNFLSGLSNLFTRIGSDLSSWVNDLRQLDSLTEPEYVVDSPQSKLVHLLDEVRAAPQRSSSSVGQTAQNELLSKASNVHQVFSTTPNATLDILGRIVTMESRRSAIPLKYTSGFVNGYADLGKIQEDFGNSNATQLFGGMDLVVLGDGLIHVKGLFNQSLVDTISPLQTAESILAERRFRGLTSQFANFGSLATNDTMVVFTTIAAKTVPDVVFSEKFSGSMKSSTDLRIILLSVGERTKRVVELHTESDALISEMGGYLPAADVTDINTVPGHITKFQQFKKAQKLVNNLEEMETLMESNHKTLNDFDVKATIQTLSGEKTEFDNFVKTNFTDIRNYFDAIKQNGTDITSASEAVQMVQIAQNLDDRMVTQIDLILNSFLSLAPQITNKTEYAVSLSNGKIVQIDELERLKDLGGVMKVVGDSTMALSNVGYVDQQKPKHVQIVLIGNNVYDIIHLQISEPRKSELKRVWNGCYPAFKTTSSGVYYVIDSRKGSIQVVVPVNFAVLKETFSAFIGLQDVTFQVDDCQWVLKEMGQFAPQSLKDELDDFTSQNFQFASSTAPLAQVVNVLPQLDLIFTRAAAISPNAPPPAQTAGPNPPPTSTSKSPVKPDESTKSSDYTIFIVIGGVVAGAGVSASAGGIAYRHYTKTQKSEKDDVEAGMTSTKASGDSSDVTAQQAQQVPQAVPVESNESVKDSGESKGTEKPVEQAGGKVDEKPAVKTAAKATAKTAAKKTDKNVGTPAVKKAPKAPAEDITTPDFWFKYATKKPAFDKGGNPIGFVIDAYPKGHISKLLDNITPKTQNWHLIPEYDTTKSRASQCLAKYLEVNDEKEHHGKVKQYSTRKNAKRLRLCLKRTAADLDLDLNVVKGVLTEYIVGSAPTESTIDAFMKFLLLSKCKQVVMCCPDEESYQYLPKKVGEKKKIGKLFTVELKSREVSHKGELVVCTFYIHAPDRAPKPMMHIQLPKWEKGDELSEYKQAAMADAHWLTALSKDPALVISQDGNERAATFAGSQIGYEYYFSSEKYNTALPSFEQAFLIMRNSRYGSVQSPKTFLHMLWLPLSWLKNSKCIPEFEEPEVKKKFEKLTRIVNNCDGGPEKSDKDDWKKHCSMVTKWKNLDKTLKDKKKNVAKLLGAEAKAQQLQLDRFEESNRTLKEIRRNTKVFYGVNHIWTVIGILGEGSFGCVFDVVNEKNVPGALKSAGFDSIEMEQEKRVLESNASDPHALHLLDHGKDKDADQSFVVETKCKELEEPKNPAALVRTYMEALISTKRMHDRGFLHRDIKWENAGMSAEKGSQRVILFDLGMARQYAKLTKSGYVLRYKREKAQQRGTVHFASLNYHELKEMGRVDDMFSLLFTMSNKVHPLPWINLKKDNEIYEMKKKEMDRYFHETNPIVAEIFGPIYDMLKTYSYSDRPDYYTIFAMLHAHLTRLGEHFDGVTEDPAYIDAAFEEMRTEVIEGGTGLILPRHIKLHDPNLDDLVAKCMQTRTEAPQMRRHPKAIQNLGEILKKPYLSRGTKNTLFYYISFAGLNFPIVPEDQWSQGDTISLRMDAIRTDAGADKKSTVKRDEHSHATRRSEKRKAHIAVREGRSKRAHSRDEKARRGRRGKNTSRSE